MRRRSRALGVALAVAAAAAPAPSIAEEPPRGRFSAAAFEPAPAGDRFLRIETPELLGHGAFDLLALTDIGINPFVVERPGEGGDQVPVAVVQSQVLFHLGAAVTLWDRWKLSLDMPFGASTVANSVERPIQGETTGGWSAGDLRLGARFRVGGDPDDPFILSLGGRVFVPTGDDERFVGEGAARGGPRVVLGGRVDPITWGFTGGFDFRPRVAAAGVNMGTQFVVDTGFATQIGYRSQLLFEIHAAAVVEGDPLERETGSFEALLGMRMRFDDVVAALGPAIGTSLGGGAPLLRAVLSLSYAPLDRLDLGGPSTDEDDYPAPPSLPYGHGDDADHDGIHDGADACPSAPGSPSRRREVHGCPDADGDGVGDSDDLCPARPGTRRGQRPGCPAQDRDKDGIDDPDDSCPDLPGAASPLRRDNGCPPDADGDGVYDGEDACPHQRGRFSVNPDKNGCPAAPRPRPSEAPPAPASEPGPPRDGAP
ncbi:MAG: thrombospondin type 3 repeat-containing protein [Polyangiaceae bacterium]|nr:thrombospondin type 3 repeat-containing protein [Polyangiaceae bacterium]